MWCDNCQADRAAEANAETQEITCATCGEKLAAQQFGKLDRQMQKARELLERWSKEPLLEPYSPLPDKHASHLPELRELDAAESDVEPVSETLHDLDTKDSIAELTSMGHELEKFFNKSPQTKIRYDRAHGSDLEEQPQEAIEISVPNLQSEEHEHADPPLPAVPPAPPQPQTPIEEIQQAEPVAEIDRPVPPAQDHHERDDSKVLRTDPVPRQVAPPTHLNIQQLIEERLEQKSKKINWMMMVGQWLAYLGVLAMTAGAAVIVFGYFGSEAGMTPRGWMLTTAGQMLLFLGIVTLISSGMERSSEEITDRIDLLGEQLIRLEAVTREHFVPGPKISSERYAEVAETPHSEPAEEDAEQRV